LKEVLAAGKRKVKKSRKKKKEDGPGIRLKRTGSRKKGKGQLQPRQKSKKLFESGGGGISKSLRQSRLVGREGLGLLITGNEALRGSEGRKGKNEKRWPSPSSQFKEKPHGEKDSASE